jgi:hypothetical protein
MNSEPRLSAVNPRSQTAIAQGRGSGMLGEASLGWDRERVFHRSLTRELKKHGEPVALLAGPRR